MRISALAAVALAAAPLAGCGFTPMYATPAVSPALSSIQAVLPGTSRPGYLLKDQLNRELARDEDEPAHYRLDLTVSESRIPRGVRGNNVANRYELDFRASYSLTDASTDELPV